jgi:hypothetical protein
LQGLVLLEIDVHFITVFEFLASIIIIEKSQKQIIIVHAGPLLASTLNPGLVL